MNTETKRVLVVDDEESVRKLVSDIISSRGYEVLSAVNGLDALAVLSDNDDIDLVVTDLVMPELNGIDLIVAIKDINQDISIVAISGGGGITGRFDYLPVAKLIGASSVINKPFDPDVLLEAVIDQIGK